MPPKLKFTRDEIVQAALTIVSEKGVEALTAKELGDAQLIVFGHSHKYFEQTIDGRLWLNPGSCGKRRFDQEISFALLHIDGGAWRVERIVLKQ